MSYDAQNLYLYIWYINYVSFLLVELRCSKFIFIYLIHQLCICFLNFKFIKYKIEDSTNTPILKMKTKNAVFSISTFKGQYTCLWYHHDPISKQTEVTFFHFIPFCLYDMWRKYTILPDTKAGSYRKVKGTIMRFCQLMVWEHIQASRYVPSKIYEQKRSLLWQIKLQQNE